MMGEKKRRERGLGLRGGVRDQTNNRKRLEFSKKVRRQNPWGMRRREEKELGKRRKATRDPKMKKKKSTLKGRANSRREKKRNGQAKKRTLGKLEKRGNRVTEECEGSKKQKTCARHQQSVTHGTLGSETPLSQEKAKGLS